MSKQYQHGFIVGKFMPLHQGHCFLVDTAIASCARVTVLLLSEPDEPIDGFVRQQWLEVLYPTCMVVHIHESLPRDASGYDHWDVWLQTIIQYCPGNYDAVFSSETYGERLAADMAAKHVLVDQARTLVPISGTKIRSNPSAYFEYLPAIVREYYENQN